MTVVPAFELDDAIAARLGLHYEDGWHGIMTRHDAPGALYGGGTRIEKRRSEKADYTADGTKGTVLGSLRVPETNRWCVYFVEWDDKPRHSALVIEWRLALATEGS